MPQFNAWRTITIICASASIPMNILLMVWMLLLGLNSTWALPLAYVSSVPAAAILGNLYLIFSTGFKPTATLCCLWGWLFFLFLFILPDLALNIYFVILIFAPYDPSGKTDTDIKFNRLLYNNTSMASICIMILALMTLSLLTFIVYHCKLRRETAVT